MYIKKGLRNKRDDLKRGVKHKMTPGLRTNIPRKLRQLIADIKFDVMINLTNRLKRGIYSANE